MLSVMFYAVIVCVIMTYVVISDSLHNVVGLRDRLFWKVSFISFFSLYVMSFKLIKRGNVWMAFDVKLLIETVVLICATLHKSEDLTYGTSIENITGRMDDAFHVLQSA